MAEGRGEAAAGEVCKADKENGIFLMKCGKSAAADGSVSMRHPAAGNLKPPSVAVCPWGMGIS